jgi:hypothetical protein
MFSTAAVLSGFRGTMDVVVAVVVVSSVAAGAQWRQGSAVHR